MVLGFGYVVAAGPVGFLSQWAQAWLGFVPWNIYSMFSIVVIAGLTHVPHAYLYISSALRSVGSDVEEAARTVGATPLQVMTSVSLPMVRPSILYACVLLFFLGLEVFGLMLVLGDPEGNMVLATYLYKLTNKLGTPSYHLMAAVAVVLICITIPLVMLQRRLMRTANRFVTMKGKASQSRALPLGKWRWVAGAVVVAWLTVTIGVPLLGVALRAFISNWGVGVSLWDELSLATFRNIWQQPNLLRAIVNSMAIGIIGGALAVVCYLFVGIAMHRKPDNVTRFLDYSVLVPRAVPGLLAGLAFLWVFLFVPMWLDQSLKMAGSRRCRSPTGCANTLSCNCARCATPFSASGWPIRWCGWPTACALSHQRSCRWRQSWRRPRAAPAPLAGKSPATSPFRWHATGLSAPGC